jgi:hypothetical protein
MSQFHNSLISRNIIRHTGQALWKYNINEIEFNNLRRVLMEVKCLTDIDTRDCTLYYAEWWKRCYNGGFPSKDDIFTSISNGQSYDGESFYRHAKKGANLLGIPWIKHQNTLYFKTLLLQGGLPIKHISNNRGAYKKFLLRILELNPLNIDDFAFDPTITSLLPVSAQNDEIYECCLAVVKAINSDDEEYLALLEKDQDLKEISGELRITKQSLTTSRNQSRFKAAWVFEPEKAQVRLYLSIPELSAEQFSNLFLVEKPDVPLDFEYKLFYNDFIVCKFIKRANGNYRTDWITSNLCWDGNDGFPDIYASNTGGVKFNCKYLITHLPRLDKPTLWSQYSEAHWTMEKGGHTNREEGFILVPADYQITVKEGLKNLQLYGLNFLWIPFTNIIQLTREFEQYVFKTNSKKIEWYFAEQNPKWMQRANGYVARGNPSLSVYDEKGNSIKNICLRWRQKPRTTWNDWSVPVPLGWTEIEIQTEHVIEYEEFFNIGFLDATITSSSLHKAEVELSDNFFSFRINESAILGIDKINANKICLNIKDTSSLPIAIQASVKMAGQSRSLTYEMVPPFQGVEIIDSLQRIVSNDTALQQDALCGYRLLSNQNNLVANFFNTRRPSIIVSEYLKEKFIPLRTFEDTINQLFTLSDSMDSEAEIVMEVFENQLYSQIKIKSYTIQRYNQKIDWTFDKNQQLVIKSGPASVDLYAVPLDCRNDQLELCDLENNGTNYFFRERAGPDKFIVFSSKENDVKVQPAFVSLDPENQLTTYEDRIQRIINLKAELLVASYNDDVWQLFLNYYTICVKNELPFSTFDILRTLGFSSLLAAKSFVFLACFDESQNFADDTSKMIENDLGFSFHWINRDHWSQAMEWLCNDSDPELILLLSTAVKAHFDNLNPNHQFSKISNYVLQDSKPKIEPGYHLNGRINQLRGSLGVKVLTELPEKCPKVPEIYKAIIPVCRDTAAIKILLKSPLSVALSIGGKCDGLWGSENENIRRNVKYSQQLDPEWYGEAINYALSKI